jgi:hypothetical protein
MTTRPKAFSCSTTSTPPPWISAEPDAAGCVNGRRCSSRFAPERRSDGEAEEPSSRSCELPVRGLRPMRSFPGDGSTGMCLSEPPVGHGRPGRSRWQSSGGGVRPLGGTEGDLRHTIPPSQPEGEVHSGWRPAEPGSEIRDDPNPWRGGRVDCRSQGIWAGRRQPHEMRRHSLRAGQLDGDPPEAMLGRRLPK